MGLGDKVDTLTTIIMASTLLVGFWEVGSGLGSVSRMVQQAVNDPHKTGTGTMLFLIGYDVWSPVVNASYWGPFSFVSWFYPFSVLNGTGYLPHYSIESCLISLTISFIVTWIFLHVTDCSSFWGWGLLVAFLSFILTWYVFTLIMWQAMFLGAEMMGLSSEQTYTIWKTSAENVQSPYLQMLFLANIPLSAQYLVRKYV